MIKGCCKTSKYNKAHELFKEMQKYPTSKPNLITYNCILDVCVKQEDLEKAVSIFSEIKEVYTPDLITFSTMIKGKHPILIYFRLL